ncbi:MAG: dipeptide/oligopeptide/nickel ABC transporter ATP-binding protein [Puniceicoccales bacterium]|jgi:ABC-type glutathione transport system ATPase component|nr:dipeptide/oligopeptide/nickel ABC transporter ATP-binding protein [Puniceicoccales bacterium]
MRECVGHSQELTIRNGTVLYRASRSFEKTEYLAALKDVSLSISPGECFGLIGESGGGKSTLGRCFARLQKLTAGEILLNGHPSCSFSAKSFHRKVQMIFQSPAEALDPSQTIYSILAEPLRIHFPGLGRRERKRRIFELLDLVRLSQKLLNSKPLALSGGQRQRVAIARALAVGPNFLICDEVVSALDSDTKKEIFNLLEFLRKTNGTGILFISHDTNAISQLCPRAAILHWGKLLATIPSQELPRTPKFD